MAELPFMATENIMMDCVKRGGNRQELHERIRKLSMKAGKNIKENGEENNLPELIASDETFGVSLEEIKQSLDPSKYTGCAAHQTERFLDENVRPVLQRYKDMLGDKAEVKV